MTSSLSSNPAARACLADAAALLAGALQVGAFAPFGLFPLAPLTLAALYLVWLDATPGRAFRRGYLFGMGLFGAGITWVFVSIERFGNAGPALALVVTIAFVALLAVFPALAGYLVRRALCAGAACTLIIGFPAAWIGLEWVRGWLFTGFPWLSVGYSQIDGPLAGLAPAAGVHGVGAAAALSAGLIAYALHRRAAAPRWLAVGALLALWVGAAGLGRVEWTQASGPPLRVALVQGNIPQTVKWEPGQRERTLQLYAELTRAQWGHELIVWPETAVPAFYGDVADYLEGLAREARAHGAGLVVGVPVRGADGYYNSVASLGAGEPAFYHKRHLVPFGEYIPFVDLLGPVLDLLRVPMSDFSVGPADPPPLPLDGVSAGVTICYEDAYPAEARSALPEAGLLINVSNDAWFGDSLAPHQHLEIARMRSRETGRWMLRATNTGISAVIGPAGAVRDRVPQFERRVLSARVEPRDGATPYVRLGDWPVLGLVVAGLVAGAWRRRSGGRSV